MVDNNEGVVTNFAIALVRAALDLYPMSKLVPFQVFKECHVLAYHCLDFFDGRKARTVTRPSVIDPVYEVM